MRNPRQRSEDNQIGMWDNATDHAECFAGCGQNLENPYDPNGHGAHGGNQCEVQLAAGAPCYCAPGSGCDLGDGARGA